MPEQRDSGLVVPDGTETPEEASLELMRPALTATARALDRIADDGTKADVLAQLADLDEAGLRQVERWASKLQRIAAAGRRGHRKAAARGLRVKG